MSAKDPTYKELRKFLTKVKGLVHEKQHAAKGTSHEKYVGYDKNGKYYYVGLDKNHNKFPGRTQKNLVASIARQLGLRKNQLRKELEKMLNKK